MDLCNINDITALLTRHGFRFSKALGQNFLIQDWVPRDIAAASGADETSGVLEIGPGIGCLTVELSRRAGRVATVELDRALLPILEETLAGRDNVTVLPGNILELDLAALVAEQFDGLTPMVCANLPYNITTPVLQALLDSGLFSSITVLLQKEAAQRLMAGPGERDYGAFSLYCQYKAELEYLFEVPRECFLPAPKVTSAVLRLTPRPRPACVKDEKLFFSVVHPAFTYRRKTLLNALGNTPFGQKLSKEVLAQCITAAGFPPTIRGEALSIENFARVADSLQAALEAQ